MGAYLGKKADALTTGGASGKYGLIGNAKSWYVVYTFDENDSTGTKEKLASKSKAADLYGGAARGIDSYTDYYRGSTETCVALKVR